MAEAPFKITDRRGSEQYRNAIAFTEPVARRYDGQRRYVEDFNDDASRLVTRYSREALVSMGRYLYQNASPVRSALNQMAELGAMGIQQQFDGLDVAWGKQAEGWLYDNDRVCCVNGGNYTMSALREMLILCYLRDGDSFVLLTETANGYPQFQHIPAHRIGSRGLTKVIGGTFDGYRIQDGVVVNDVGRPIGYQILGDTSKDDRYVSADSIVPVFLPEYPDQVRGIPPLVAAILDCQDVSESRRLEMVSQKVFSGQSLIVHNEEGGPTETANQILGFGSGGLNAQGQPTTDGVPVAVRELIPGEIRYFRAGSNSKVEAVTGDRPTQNQREFAHSILRQAIASIGWSIDIALDPTKAGGAQMRVVLDLCNRRLAQIRERMLYPVLRRLDGYRIAKAQILGIVPRSDEWYKWDYVSPAELTADKKYEAQVALDQYKAGWITGRQACARLGLWYDDVVSRRETETRELIDAAKRIAAETGTPFETALVLLRDTGAYSSVTNSAAAMTPGQTNEPTE